MDMTTGSLFVQIFAPISSLYLPVIRQLEAQRLFQVAVIGESPVTSSLYWDQQNSSKMKVSSTFDQPSQRQLRELSGIMWNEKCIASRVHSLT